MRIEVTKANRTAWKMVVAVLGSGKGAGYNSWLVLDGKTAFTACGDGDVSIEMELPEAVDHPVILHAAQVRAALKIDANALQVDPYLSFLATINGVQPRDVHVQPKSWIEAREQFLARAMHKKVGVMQLDMQAVAKVSPFMAVKDIRDWLNGVCVEFATGRIVATDGHTMAISQPGAASFEAEPDGTQGRNVLIRREAIELIQKAGWDRLEVYQPLPMQEDSADPVKSLAISVPFDGGRLLARGMEGVYPDYRRQLEKTVIDASKNGYAEAVFQCDEADLERHIRAVKSAGRGRSIELGLLVDAWGHVAAAEESPVPFRKPATVQRLAGMFTTAMVDAQYLLRGMKALGTVAAWKVSASDVWSASSPDLTVLVMPMHM